MSTVRVYDLTYRFPTCNDNCGHRVLTINRLELNASLYELVQNSPEVNLNLKQYDDTEENFRIEVQKAILGMKK